MILKKIEQGSITNEQLMTVSDHLDMPYHYFLLKGLKEEDISPEKLESFRIVVPLMEKLANELLLP